MAPSYDVIVLGLGGVEDVELFDPRRPAAAAAA
ncbi:hypothetical protein BKA18_000665 [Streptomyces auratus]